MKTNKFSCQNTSCQPSSYYTEKKKKKKVQIIWPKLITYQNRRHLRPFPDPLQGHPQ